MAHWGLLPTHQCIAAIGTRKIRARKRTAVNRTDLLTAAISKLSDAVALLSDAGEVRSAAQLEDIIHQIEISLLENRTPPNSQPEST